MCDTKQQALLKCEHSLSALLKGAPTVVVEGEQSNVHSLIQLRFFPSGLEDLNHRPFGHKPASLTSRLPSPHGSHDSQMIATPVSLQVLIIGGGDGGVLREVVKHPLVETVIQCEIDEVGTTLENKTTFIFEMKG